MNANPPILPRDAEGLQKSLAVVLRQQSNINLEQIEICQLIDRLWSQIYHLRAHTTERDYKLILKCNGKVGSIPDKTQQEKTAAEFEIMQFVYDRIQEADGCSVARPIAVLKDQAALVLEFADGDVLSSKTRFGNFFSDKNEFGRLIDAYRLCGRWLRQFQRITHSAPRSGEVAIASVISRLETRLEIVSSATTALVPRKLPGQVRKMVDQLVGELKGIEIQMAGRHSDFGPWNMLVSDKKLTVLDFHDYDIGPVPEDVMKILIHLDRSSRYLTSSGARYDLLLRAFLAGYGRPTDAPQPLISLLEIMERIQFIAARVKKKMPKNPYRRFEWLRDLRYHIFRLQKIPKAALSWKQIQSKADH